MEEVGGWSLRKGRRSVRLLEGKGRAQTCRSLLCWMRAAANPNWLKGQDWMDGLKMRRSFFAPFVRSLFFWLVLRSSSVLPTHFCVPRDCFSTWHAHNKDTHGIPSVWCNLGKSIVNVKTGQRTLDYNPEARYQVEVEQMRGALRIFLVGDGSSFFLLGFRHNKAVCLFRCFWDLSDDQDDEDQDLPLAGSDAAAKKPWLPIHV